MKQLKRACVYFIIYILLTIGAIMSIQSHWLYIFPSIATISLGIRLIEYYARNYKKFK